MTAGVFLQGTSFQDVNANGVFDPGEPGVVGVSIKLYDQTGTTLLGQTTTDSAGRYLFDDTHNVTSGNLLPGNYKIVQAGVTGLVGSAVDAQSGLYPYTIQSESSVTVTAVDPAGLTLYYFLRPVGKLGLVYYFDPNDGSPEEDKYHESYVGQFHVRATGPLLPAVDFISICVDIPHGVSEGDTFPVRPYSANGPNGLPGRSAEAAYLYNHYGRSLLDPQHAAGLQLAIYELEYDAASDLDAGNFRFIGKVSWDTDDQFATAADVANARLFANQYLAEAAGKAETAMYLDATLGGDPSIPTGRDAHRQGMIVEGSFNFAMRAGAHIGDYVWVDTNRNGQQDVGEPSIPGVTVNLLDSTGVTVLQTTTTNGSGLYGFTVDPGTYVVQVVAPAGAYDKFTTSNIGSDSSDSDVDQVTGKTGPITVVLGQTDNTNDAGLLPIDLQLSKSVDNATPLVGSNVTFTLTLTNNNAAPGVSTASGVSVSDALPPGLTFVSATASQGSYSSGSGAWTVGTLAPGASVTLAIVATVASGGTKTNYAQVTTVNQVDVDSTPNNGSPPTPNEDDEAAVTLAPPAQIGDYVWLDTNRNGQQDVGEPAISGVTVRLLDSAGVTVLQTTTTNGSGLYGFTVDPGTYVAQVVAPAGGYDKFTTSNSGSDSSDSDVNQVTGKTGPITVANGQTDNTNDAGLLPIDLQLSKSVDNARPLVGVNVTFTLTLTNSNAAPGVSTASGVSVSDPLPAGLTFVSATASQGSYSSGSGAWTVGTLAPGASATLTIVATVASGGAKTNHAQVTAANQVDTDSTPNNGSSPTPNEDDEAAVTLGPPARIGNYVWVDTNTNGQQDVGEPAITGVTVRLLDSTGVTVLQTTTTDGSGLYGFDVAPGSYMIQVVTPAGAYDKFTTSNIGSDSSDSDVDQVTGKTGLITVAAGQTDDSNDAGLMPIDLSVIKTVNNVAPAAGAQVTYTVQVANASGYSTATGVQVADLLPAGMTFVSATTTQGSYNSGSGIWDVGVLAGGQARTLTITAAVPAVNKKAIVVDTPVDGSTALRTQVTMTQVGNSIQVTVTVVTNGSSPNTGDLRGFFLKMPAGLNLNNVTVTGPDVTEVQAGYGSVTNLGGGAVINPLGPFDLGVEIGTSGMGSDDIQTTTFTMSYTQPLSLDAFSDALADYAVRATSVGLPGGSRSQSSKLSASSVIDAWPGPITNTAQVSSADQLDRDSTPNNNIPAEDDQSHATIVAPSDPGDYVWLDENVNGLQDPDERGIAGVTVSLYDAGPDRLAGTADDRLLGTKVTDNLGHFNFADVSAGSYFLHFVAPAGRVFTLRYQGSDPTIDSNADPATGYSDVVTLAEGEVDLTIDAGLRPTALPAAISSIGKRYVSASGNFAQQVQADVPQGDVLVFSLEPGAPAGAQIDPVTGVFTPPAVIATNWPTYDVTVRVTDTTWANLSKTVTLTVPVVEFSDAATFAVRNQITRAFTHSTEYLGNIVTGLYNDWLGRTPRSDEVAYWVNQMQNHGMTDEMVLAGFAGSDEFFRHSGGTSRAWVGAMYQHLLFRTAEAYGEAYWLALLANGQSRYDIAYGIAASAEREAIVVREDYRKFLGREARDDEVAYWVAEFISGRQKNGDVIAGFLASDEYFRGQQQNIRGYVMNLYQTTMGRDADEAGYNYWLNYLRTHPVVSQPSS